MKQIVPGRFNAAAINAACGELEMRLSEGGNWQLRARAGGEGDWRLLCNGNLDGSVFAPPPIEEGAAAVRFGAVRVDRVARVAEVDEQPVPLSPREFDLLALLASDPDRIFTKDELLRELWGYPERCASRTLESHASRARKKLRDAGADGLIVNYRDLGYKLWKGAVVEVSRSLGAA
jgi:DNA-binding response OmpR family regulator